MEFLILVNIRNRWVNKDDHKANTHAKRRGL